MFAVGEEVLVQFGNPSDTAGYSIEYATIIKLSTNKFGSMYAVKTNKGLIGRAVESGGELIDMHCTCAVQLGLDVRDDIHALRALGFKVESQPA